MNSERLFISQITFSIVTVGFCMGMIIRNPEPATTSIYLPIMTSIIGVWLPQPNNKEINMSYTTTTPQQQPKRIELSALESV